MFKKFISCLILISYIHQILAFTALRASEGEIDFVIKVKNKFGAINLKVRDKDKNKIVNINLEDCLASDTEEKSDVGDNLSGGGSTVDLKDQALKTESDLYGLSNLSSIYDDEHQGIGWLWDLSKYNLPNLVVGLDGSVLVDKFNSYQNQKIKLKASEISLNNCNSEHLKIKAPKINLYGSNKIKDLEIKGFSCHIAKDGLMKSEKLSVESSLINDGKIEARDLVVKGFEVFNNGKIGLSTHNAFFEVNNFENSGSIETIKTSILAKENFNNTGSLKTITSLELVSLNNLELDGKIKSRSLKIISEADVINKSFLEANQVTIKALNLDNHQEIKVNQTLDLDLKKSLVNQKTGQIKSDNLVLNNEDLEVINHGDGIETESNDESKAKINGEIVIGKLASNTKIKHIKNYGFLELGQGELQSKTFDNYGQSVMGRGDWHLGDFHNFDNAILDLEGNAKFAYDTRLLNGSNDSSCEYINKLISLKARQQELFLQNKPDDLKKITQEIADLLTLKNYAGKSNVTYRKATEQEVRILKASIAQNSKIYQNDTDLMKSFYSFANQNNFEEQRPYNYQINQITKLNPNSKALEDLLEDGKCTIFSSFINDGFVRAKGNFELNGNFKNGMGKIISQGKVAWDMTSDTKAGEVLAKSVFMAPHLTINHDNFVNDKKLIFNSPVVINAKKFSNFGEIKAKDLEIFGDDFINGQSNDLMGNIDVSYFKADLKNKLDNRFGKIWSQKGFEIKALNEVLIGESRVRQEVYNLYNGPRFPFYHDWYYTNGSFIATDDQGIIKSQNITIQDGEVYGNKALNFDFTNMLVRSGKVISKGDLRFKGAKLELTRHNQKDTSQWSHQAMGATQGDACRAVRFRVETGDPATLFVSGNLYLDLCQMITMLTHIYVDGYFNFNKQSIKPNLQIPSEIQFNSRNQMRDTYWDLHDMTCTYFGWRITPETYNPSLWHHRIYGPVEHRDIVPSNHYSIIRVGKDFKVNLPAGTMHSEASITSDGKMEIKCHDFLANLVGSINESKQDDLIVNLYEKAKKLKGAFILEDQNGTIRTAHSTTGSFNWQNQEVALLGSQGVNQASNKNSSYALDETTLEITLQQTLGEEMGALTFNKKAGKDLIRDWFKNGVEHFSIKGNHQFARNLQNYDYLKKLTKIGKPVILLMNQEINNALSNIPWLLVPADMKNYYKRNGDMKALEGVDIETTGSQSYTNNTIASNKDITLQAVGNIVRKTDRLDTKQSLLTEQNLLIKTQGNYQSTGGLAVAGGNINIHADKDLTMDTFHHVKTDISGDKNTRIVTKTTTLVGDQMVSQNMNLKSGGNVTGIGINLSANNNINIKSSGKVYIGTAVGYNTTTTTTKSKGKGWFSGGSTTTTSTSIPVFLQSELKAKRIGIHSQSIHIKGLKTKVDSLKLKAKEEIIFDSQTANMTQSMHTSSSSIFTKTSQGCGNSQEVEARNNLDVNKITANQKIKFINTDWDKTKTEIVGDFEEITKSLKSDSYSYSKFSGLGSGKILPVIALAVSLACQQYQVGASFLSSLGASGTILKMGIAGLSVLTTQAATNFIQTGDPVQVFKNLASDRSLRQVAIAIATAGVMDKVGGSLGLNLDPKTNSTLMDMAKVNLIKTGIRTAIELPISKQDPQSIVKDNILSAVADTAIGYGASKIGDWYGNTENNTASYIFHKIIHGINGGLLGKIIADRDFVSGAIGASVGEMVMEARNNYLEEKIDKVNAEAEGKNLSEEQLLKKFEDTLQTDLAWAKLTAGTVAALAGKDVFTASNSAELAGEHNNIGHFIRLLITKITQHESKLFLKEGIKKIGKDGLKKAKADKSTLKWGTTKHGVSRKIERNIKSVDELNALKNPLKIGKVKTDDLGRVSQKFYGEKVTVAINPETSKIVSVNPTSSAVLKKLLKEAGK